MASFVLVLQFFDKFFRNMFDNLSQHHHIMLLRSHVSILWLVSEKKVAWDLFFVKSERFLWDSSGINCKKIEDQHIRDTLCPLCAIILHEQKTRIVPEDLRMKEEYKKYVSNETAKNAAANGI